MTKLPFFLAATAISASLLSGTDYRSAVLPIMKDHCWKCHSNEHEVKGSLALDDLEEMRDYQIGPHNLIRPGDAEKSDFVQRLKLDPTHSDFMPRKESALRPREITAIEKWIEKGAIIDKENLSEEETARLQKAAMAGGETFLSWTNREGRTIEARFLGIKGDAVTIATKEGRNFDVPLEALDEKSALQAKELAAQ